jgi:hypothetical protein
MCKLAAVTLLTGTLFDRCPHATYFVLAPVPIPFAIGDPCRNGRDYTNLATELLQATTGWPPSRR